MGLTAPVLRAAILRAAGAARAAEHELNAADGKLGDGDTGVMLRRLLDRVSAAVPAGEADVGAVFQAFAAASATATGSSLGTLGTVAMLTLAKETRGRTDIDWSELGGLLEKVRDAMMARGGAALGDKTVVDVLDTVARVLSGPPTPDAFAEAARHAARSTLESFRTRPSRVGRARMFGEKSVGIDDPGMLAFVRLLDGICQSQPERV